MTNVSEPAKEAFLYQIWKKKGLVKQSLAAINGQAIVIHERGIQNFDAGPDFINALIEVNGSLQRGDVEIHPIAGDWYAHGHHRDPRYNQVILHVVTMNCPADFLTLKQDGVRVPTINLDTILEAPAEELEQRQQPETPGVQFCGLSEKPLSQIQRALEAAGHARFMMHVNQFKELRMNFSWDQVMYQALLESLGYSKNQVAFRNLAQRLPVETMWEYIWQDPKGLALKKCEACLFGTAGLLPSQSVINPELTDPDVVEYVQSLENCWKDFPLRPKLTPLKPEAWKFFRLRPQNFPTRRIAAAARLVMRFMDDGFVDGFYRLFSEPIVNTRQLLAELERMLTLDVTGYWETHYRFGPLEKSDKNKKQLVGQDRIRDMLANVVLPSLYAFAVESDDHRCANQVLELYNQFPPLTDNQITRRMIERTRLDRMEHTARNLRIQQGLLHLAKFYCQSGECRQCESIFEQQQ